MDSINSFKGYGKVDNEAEQKAFKNKTLKRIIVIILSSIVLLAIIIAALLGTLVPNRHSSDSTAQSSSSSLKAACDVTLHPKTCVWSISSLPNYSNSTTDPHQLFTLSLQLSIQELSKLSQYPSKLRPSFNHHPRLQMAIDVCGTVLSDAVSNLNDSISALGGGGMPLPATKISDIETWLSAAITNQDTCLDALGELNSTAANTVFDDMRTAMKNSTEYTSNSLAILTKILGLLSKFSSHSHRRLMGFPEWVGPEVRRLLQDGDVNTRVVPDAVVAKDGSGQYTRINEAVAAVKKNSEKRFIIYVKEGTYVENIDLDRDSWNVMIYGDGKTKTIISGSRNAIDGTNTFQTATFGVSGKGFIAKDIGFVNTAGAVKQQAVALRSGSDRSVFLNCSFDGFQDTLYAHSNRQFYRDCDIAGTIDFIFGNAAAVLQNCRIMAKQPLPKQYNTITAQSKSDPNQNTGIVIQKSEIVPLHDGVEAATYLGRPWKNYSTTVIMQCEIASILDPAGWITWDGGNGIHDPDPPNTIFYAEYQNSGPGSDLSRRVKWPGYTPALTTTQAAQYTVQAFIQGPDWLPSSFLHFDSTF